MQMRSHGFLLAPSIERFRSVVPSHNATVWIMDDDGIVSERNQVGLRLDNVLLPHQLLLHLFLLGDSGPNADPLDHVAICAPYRHPADEDEARDPVRPVNAALHFIDLSCRKGLDACHVKLLSVIGMNRVQPASTERVRSSLTGESTPGRTFFVHQAIRSRDPEQVGRGFSNGTKAVFADTPRVLLLCQQGCHLTMCLWKGGSRDVLLISFHTTCLSRAQILIQECVEIRCSRVP